MRCEVIKKNRHYNWYLIPLSVIAVILSAIPVYAYLTNTNINTVGQVIFTIFTVGQSTYTQYVVGGISHPDSNITSQSVLPVIAVVIVLLYALKSALADAGISGFIRTAFILVIGSILLVAILSILSQLT